MDENHKEGFPFEIEHLDPEENQELYDYLKGSQGNFVCIGPKKFFFPSRYLSDAAKIYNFPLRTEDVFVITFPKSGTTMVQDLVWLIRNNLDYEKAKSISLHERFPFLEISSLIPAHLPGFYPDDHQKVLRKSLAALTLSEIKEMPSPRHIKSHVALSLLPNNLLDTTKVVYVARDPRDVAVSFYHHNRMTRQLKPEKEFKPFWKYFVMGKMRWGPYFEHVLEAWEKRHHPNMLFLFYEELMKDLAGSIRRVADFLGRNLTDDEVSGLCQHLNFDNFKTNKSVNMDVLRENEVFMSEERFVRKGKIGGWQDYFDEEMTVLAEEWISKYLNTTDFKFSHF